MVRLGLVFLISASIWSRLQRRQQAMREALVEQLGLVWIFLSSPAFFSVSQSAEWRTGGLVVVEGSSRMLSLNHSSSWQPA